MRVVVEIVVMMVTMVKMVVPVVGRVIVEACGRGVSARDVYGI